MSRQQESWDELIHIIEAELHPEDKNSTNAQPLSQPPAKKKPRIVDGRVPLFNSQFLLIVGITLLCTHLCRLLPDELLLISAIIHGVNVVLFMVIMLTQGKKCWHMLYWLVAHKFISIMGNNSHGSVLHKNTFIQLSCSIVLYCIYMYNTHNTSLSLASYTIIVWVGISIVIVQAWPGGCDFSHIMEMGQGWVLIGYYVVSCYYNTTNRQRASSAGKATKAYSLSERVITWLMIKPSNSILHHHVNQQSYGKIIWLSFSLFTILCTVQSPRKHWLWMLMWLVSVVFGNGTSHSIAYLKNRHINMTIAWLVTMVGQWVLLLHTGTQSQSVFMFHFTTLLSMLIMLLHTSLQHFLHFESSPQMGAVCNVALINFSAPNHSQCQRDKPYKQSMQRIMIDLQLMLVGQLAITYNTYTYVHYYHSSRISNNSQEQNRFYGSWGHDRNLCSKTAVGYVIMAVFVLVVSKLAMRDRENESNTKAQFRRERIGKFMIGYMLLSWVLYIYQHHSQVAGYIRHFLQLTPFSLTLVVDANTDTYYNILYNMHACHQSKCGLFLLIFITVTTIYLIFYVHRFKNSIMTPTYLQNITYWLYRICVLAMYLATLGLVNQLYCVEVGWFAAWALAATVLILARPFPK